MDYTKDAILIHEGMKEFRKASSSSLEQNYGYAASEAQATIATTPILTIDSNYPVSMRNGTQHVSSVFLRNLNGSLSSLAVPTSPPSPISSLSLPFDDEHMSLNESLEYIPYNMRPETYIVPVLFAIIFIIGVMGNGTLIVIFIKHRSMRNVPNMFIVSLAIGDLLVILFCVPFTSTVYTVDSWPYGLVVCKFSEFIKDLSQCVSVFTLTALSADRYFAIVDPMRKLTGRRATRITIISIVGIWTLSVLFALPSALYSYIRVFPEFDPDEGSGNGSGTGELGEDEYAEMDSGRTLQVCYPYPIEFGPVYAQSMVMFHFLVYYAVPLCFIATFYIIMARHLVLSTRNIPGEAQGQGKQIQARKKVAKMILSFVVIFAICFFPHHLFLLWFYFYPDAEESFNDFWNVCRILGFCLSFANSCINPITLYCVSGTFRKQFNDHLFCCLYDQSGNLRATGGGRQSVGGTLRGGGNGGLCAACVSLTGNNGQLHADSRYGNGDPRGNGRLTRGSTMNSDRMTSKRRSTWETQTTVVNHRLLNIGRVNGKNANVHVNMCSEHEHIPLKNMTLQTSPNSKPTSATTRDNFNSHLCKQHNHNNTTFDPSTTTALLSSRSSRRRSISSMNKTNKIISDNRHLCYNGEDQNQLHTNFIEEETEKSRSSSTTSYNDGKFQNIHLNSNSPTKAFNKVGEILNKISQNYTSANPKRVSSGGSSPSKHSPVKLSLRRSSSFTSDQGLKLNLEKVMNFNNNNINSKTTPESREDYTETTDIHVLELRYQSNKGNKLRDVGGQVICYN